MGFVNSTFNEKSPNMTLCQNTIKGVVSDSFLFYDYLMSPEYETLVNSAASF